MTIEYTVVDFPTIPIRSQLFHVPGAANEAGLTAGGVRMLSPEPGGRSMLEIQPSLRINEWQYPEASWLMSQGNGVIFRVRLIPTPQVCTAQFGGVPWQPDTPWNNDQPWSGDVLVMFTAAALEGSNVVAIDLSSIGQILKRGHVIGHQDNCYKVDAISYDDNDVAIITIKPPLRKNVVIGDVAFLRPYFLGTISNAADVRVTYDAENVGLIQLGKIILDEAII